MVGDRLITSGTDGIFPEGIKVGVVKKLIGKWIFSESRNYSIPSRFKNLKKLQ